MSELTHELRLGRWQDVLADVERCDVILTDPPYSERTHAGFRTGADIRQRDAIAYQSVSVGDIEAFTASWLSRCERWSLTFGDHTSFRLWELSWDKRSWVTFAPVVWLKSNAPPRFSGDGPQSAAEYICVARPRRRVREHSGRPGWYQVQTVSPLGSVRPTGVIGTKDVAGLKRILYDYTRPGDLVVDPYAGTATVGQACIETHRSYIGCEMDPKTYALGMKRLKGATACLPGMEPDRWGGDARTHEQSDLFGA